MDNRERVIQGFAVAFEGQPDFLVRAPGRVDVIGAHTDYNQGWILAAAIDRDVWMAVRADDQPLLTLRALDMDAEASFPLDDLEAEKGGDLPGWARYAAGVAWSLGSAGLATPGCQIALASSVPVGAGLSSSAAVEVAYASAWQHLGGWPAERMTMAKLCQKAENQYVGVNSGLMDQFASLHGQAGKALLFDCRTLDWEAVPLPADVTLVIADTGTRRTLATSHYNERRADCEQAAEILKGYVPDVVALRDVSAEEFQAFKAHIPEPARLRAAHIIAENGRVLAAAEALRSGDAIRLGQLMDESHLSARDLFEASGPALDAMWKAAHGHPARLGGRFVGAGWAGCMVFLARSDGCADFIAYLRRAYQAATGVDPTLYQMQAGNGAEVID